MADRALPIIELEDGIPTLVKPWQIRYDSGWLLVIRETELRAIPIALTVVKHLVRLGVATVSAWPDGNPRYLVQRNAPDVILTRHGNSVVVALDSEDS